MQPTTESDRPIIVFIDESIAAAGDQALLSKSRATDTLLDVYNLTDRPMSRLPIETALASWARLNAVSADDLVATLQEIREVELIAVTTASSA